MSRIWKSACFLIAMFCAIETNILLGQQTNEILIQGNRVGRDKGEDFPVQATPVSWDFEHGVLTVRLADGVLREIDVNHLHTNDRRAVERVMRQAPTRPRANRITSNPTVNRSSNSSGNPPNQPLTITLNNPFNFPFNNPLNIPIIDPLNNPAMNSVTSPGNDGGLDRNSKGLVELPFLKDFAEAQQAAEGSGADRSSRPILWFRVLGELDGLM